MDNISVEFYDECGGPIAIVETHAIPQRGDAVMINFGKFRVVNIRYVIDTGADTDTMRVVVNLEQSF
jgi:hypothetical protein